ncbi:MAG: hypothetical protein ACYC3X_23745, partial [Pirellulaceae bacterium]
MKHAVNCFTTWILLVLAFLAAAAQAQEETVTKPADHETADHETADHETADHETADHETADHETADH